MGKVLIIGAGGVGAVVAFKCAQQSEIFTEIMLASRTLSKCDKIAQSIGNQRIKTAQLDADNVAETVALIERFEPDIVINVALPYQDLNIMEACLQTKTSYLDTANYEPKEVAKFEYKWQWAYNQRFKDAGILAILGCGFDPGVTGVFTSYAQKHYFEQMNYLDIVDCNAGDHGKAFATNFNPEINIREITQKGKYWKDGQWIETQPLEIHKPIQYPNIGAKESYLLFHEELESLVKNFPTLKQARFWMTFGEKYINVLNVLQEVGMTSIKPILYEGREIVPLQFLKAVLPEPASLGAGYKGQTSIGCQIKGLAKESGKELTYYVWNNCDHAQVFKECGAQAVSYTTGVPAMIGAMMYLKNQWTGVGVKNVEEFDPDPFMEQLNCCGLPWHEQIGLPLPVESN
ncbi:MAG: saccharopine dehydrogenase family protein [Bacteroidales bacterium]|jgi:saccharopine dehydrogenase (NAD+, L-lysine-forming)|nr:saccharopine dehydrogenase family protein [Bacteroidales bacterium]